MKRTDAGKDVVGSSSMVALPGALNTGRGTCQVCGTPVHADARVIRCPGCDAPHHLDCWRYNNEQCAIFGCRMGNAAQGAGRRSPAPVPGKVHVVPPDFVRNAPPPNAGFGTLAKIVGTLMLIGVLAPSSGSKRQATWDNGQWDHEKISHMLQWGDGPPRVRACEMLGTLPAWNEHDWYWIQNAAQLSGYPEVRMAALRTLAASKQRPDQCRAVVRGATEDRDARVAQLANQLLAGR